MFKNGLLFEFGFFWGKYIAICIVKAIKLSVDVVKVYNETGDVNQVKETIFEKCGVKMHETSDKTERVIGF